MKKNIPKTLILTVLSTALVSVSSAQTTLDFNDLSSVNGVGTLTAGGSNTGLSVSRAAASTNFVYTVTYVGDLGDGDTSDDTLTFDVLVEAFSGTTFSGGNTAGQPVAIGTTDLQVLSTYDFGGIDFDYWFAGDRLMSSGESLKFSIDNFVVTTTAAGTSGAAVSTGFDGTFLNEWRQNGHSGNVSGEDTIIQTFAFNNNQDISSLSPSVAALYVNSTSTTDNFASWGVQHVDFGIDVTVIPEPGAYALIAGCFGLAFVMLRRRTS
ncbi:MAG: hypothetical protein ACI8Z5_001762 [Lentimonas sp.]|jgi:hypothetical protein